VFTARAPAASSIEGLSKRSLAPARDPEDSRLSALLAAARPRGNGHAAAEQMSVMNARRFTGQCLPALPTERIAHLSRDYCAAEFQSRLSRVRVKLRLYPKHPYVSFRQLRTCGWAAYVREVPTAGVSRCSKSLSFRGRDASYLAPPAQIRTGGFPAYGSHLGSKRQTVAACVPAPVTREPGAESSACFAGPHSPWSPPFAPPTPQRIAPHCSPASQLLWQGQTSRVRT
jgi:hypothetical protein